MSVEAPPEVDADRLRQAYALLRSVVEARAGQDGVRDSEVKRHMLERDGSFDEAVLGFRKFSRFLRQAHDEEVINLERTDQGNYRVRSVSGSAKAGGATDGASKADEAPPAERERRSSRRTRRGRGDSRREQARAEKAGAEGPSSAKEAAPHSEAAGVETADAEPAEAADDEGRKPTGLLGRRRKATRAAPGGKVIPGPIDDSPDDSGSSKQVKEVSPPSTPQTRSTGLFRRGARSARRPGSRDAGAPTSAGSSDSTGAGEEARGGKEALPVDDAVELIEHMSRGYQGVGRRTAERLVEEFGDEVFEVIDNEPDRIASVLPKGRAQAVIDGRRAELEADAEGDAPTD
jgi:hypothetical protein